jgi:hypothetical protein
MARGKLDDRNLAAGQVLLLPDVAVGGDKDRETACLCGGAQIAVGQPVPPHAVGRFDLMT